MGAGFLNYDDGNSENTNTALLFDPQYAKPGAYSQNLALYDCPGDRSLVKVNRSKALPRVRGTCSRFRLTNFSGPFDSADKPVALRSNPAHSPCRLRDEVPAMSMQS